MQIMHWGSGAERMAQMTATDLSEEEYILHYLAVRYGTSYVIYRVTPLTHEGWKRWQLLGLPTVTRAQQLLTGQG